MKYVFMTDASCDLTQKQVDEIGVEVLPMEFQIEEHCYLHYPDCRMMSLDEFYEQLSLGDYCSDPDVNAALSQLERNCRRQGIPLDVHPGAEQGVHPVVPALFGDSFAHLPEVLQSVHHISLASVELAVRFLIGVVQAGDLVTNIFECLRHPRHLVVEVGGAFHDFLHVAALTVNLPQVVGDEQRDLQVAR